MKSVLFDEDYYSLFDNLKQIKIMKGILNLNSDEQDYSFEELHKQIDDLCSKNYSLLVIIYHYLSMISPKIMNDIDEIIKNRNNKINCKKLYLNFIKKFSKVSEYKEYETYIYIHRGKDVMKQFASVNKHNFDGYIEKIKNLQTDLKQNTLICRI